MPWDDAVRPTKMADYLEGLGELQKQTEVIDDAPVISTFISWLEEANIELVERDEDGDESYPMQGNDAVEKLLCRYFELDYKKLSKEREELHRRFQLHPWPLAVLHKEEGKGTVHPREDG
jgi:hypothetical protein